MSEFINEFSDNNLPQFDKFRNYIHDNDWTLDSNIHTMESEYKVHEGIIITVLNRLEHFCKKAQADLGTEKGKKITDAMVNLINIHTERVDSFLTNFDISLLKSADERTDNINFQNKIYLKTEKTKDTVEKLNLDEDRRDLSGITFFDNEKAPLSMHGILCREYPDIKRKIDEMGIDFDSPPDNEFLIYKENIPEWNEDKHYFEQEKETLQFFVDEFKKLKRGIEIDGVYIHPWLYSHLNIFKTDIPMPVMNEFTKEIESKDEFMNPPLRDNEWYIIQESYRKAEKEQLMLFIAATRRLFKSTGIASHLQWKALTGAKELIMAGASAKDLGQVEKNLKKAIQGSHPAFKILNLTNDWTGKIPFGIKKKNQKNIPMCVLNVINLKAGGDKASEVLAGYTPDAFVLDEVMKAPFIEQLDGAKPSFDAPWGKRVTPILSGTGGNESLSADALTVLADPFNNDILPMDWEILERNIPKEDITWKRTNFGTFAPAQMSAKVGMIKNETTLWQYLGIEKTEALDKIKINVTDWANCNKIILKDRDKLSKNRKSLVKETVYYPLDPEEIFLSGNVNPFPVEEAKRHRNKIIEKGDIGRYVNIYREGSSIKYELSNKQLPSYPFTGGNIDCPVHLFEEIPEVKPPYGLYASGLDDYKQEKSDGDSLGALYILKRQILNDPFSNKIVASLTTRPKPHSKFHKEIHMLLDAFNSICLMENEDMGFKEYLDTKYFTDKYLQKSFSMAGDINLQANGNRVYGLPPSSNKKTVIGMVVKYCNKRHKITLDDGSEKEVLGVELINDLGLLEEIIKYNEKGNFDRIVAFGHALIQDHYLTSNYITFMDEPKPKKNPQKNKRKTTDHSMFPKTKGGFF